MEGLKSRYIKLIGIELEGCFNGTPLNFHGDGSVNVSDDMYREGIDGRVGESNSDPTPLEVIGNYLERNYPILSNASCGMHVHFSFKNKLYYSRLMDQAFHVYFLAQLKAWGEAQKINSKHEFWRRLAGNNHYCQVSDIQADYQAGLSSKDSARYKALNFCFRLHGTLEIRVLPMFKKRTTAEKAVRACVEIINSYLDRTGGKREEKVELNLKQTGLLAPEPEKDEKYFISDESEELELVGASKEKSNGGYGSPVFKEGFVLRPE